MAGGFPILPGLSNAQDLGTVSASSTMTALTVPSAINTKSAYTQIIAATAYDCAWILIEMVAHIAGAFSVNTLTDIAIGPSGSEVVIIPNLPDFTGAYSNDINYLMLPCSIPAGTRISARYQTTNLSAGQSLSFKLFDSDFMDTSSSSFYESIGVNLSTSLGTALPNTVANSKNAYAQLISATAHDYVGFLAGFDLQGYAGGTTAPILIDIAIGPSGSEVVILPNLKVFASNVSNFNYTPPSSPFIPYPIAAGTRIAARTQSTTTAFTPGLALIGLRA